MDYDMIETDDALSVMLMKRQESLELYSIKWVFDMSKLDIGRLKKMDDQKLGMDADSEDLDYNSDGSVKSVRS